MHSQIREPETRRTRWIVASLLVGTTLLLGAATRLGATSAPPAPPDRTAFSAPHRPPVSFRGNLDRTAVLRGSDGQVRMELLIGADEQDVRFAPRLPTDLVVVLDRSGSMNGEKIRHARAAILELISRLGAQDRFALISYANQAGVEIELALASPRARHDWAARVAAIAPNGGTNMSSGLDLGLITVDGARRPGRVPRVILISDGLANQGDATLPGLLRRASRAARGEYVMSTVGVGNDFNEMLMTRLADAGTGNYYYLESAANLAMVFAGEFEAARATVASGLEVRIEPGSGVSVVDAAGYPLERVGREVIFRPGALFGGQQRTVWVTLAVPPGAAPGVLFDLGRFALHYTENGRRKTLAFTEMPRVACVAGREEYLSKLDAPTWERAVTEEEYAIVQDRVSKYVREGRRDEALREIDDYVARNKELNATVQSAPVARQLLEAKELADEVDGAFSGPDQDAKRKAASKAFGQDSIDLRRSGSKLDPTKGARR